MMNTLESEHLRLYLFVIGWYYGLNSLWTRHDLSQVARVLPHLEGVQDGIVICYEQP